MTSTKTTSQNAPKHLSTASKKWFSGIVLEYQLESSHLKLLQAAAEAWDRLQQARRLIDAEGLTFKNRHGEWRPRPEIAIEKDSAIRFARLLRELSLDTEAPGELRPPRVGGQRY